MKKIKITAVSYLNTKPLLYGLVQSPIANDIDLSLDIPSICAQKLVKGEVDLGLVPVAVIPDIPNARIVSDYCIGTNRYVKTVGIYADQPLESLTDLFLDHHSRTSVALSKILLKEHWQLAPRLLPASDGYIDKIGGSVGGVVIGDRTIGLEERFQYFYDLGNAWFEFKQLPFVFAAWVSNKELPDSFLHSFNQALKAGVQAIPQLMYLLTTPNDQFDLEQYFTQNINYQLDAPKKQALEIFLALLRGKSIKNQELVGH